MAIGHTFQDHGHSGSANTSYTTNSKTATANALQLVSVTQYGAVGGITITNFTEVLHIDFDSIAVPLQRTTILRYLGSSFTSALTINCPVGNLDIIYTWDEFTGVDTSGTNGSGAIVQSNSARSDSGTPFTVTLSSSIGANNAVFYASGLGTSGGTWTAGSGYNLINGEDETVQGISFGTQWLLPGTTTPSMTYSGGAQVYGALALEIAVASAGGGRTTKNTRSWNLGRNVGMGFTMPT